MLWLVGQRRRLIAVALGIALAAHITDSAVARPHYLSYFQPFGGGPQGGWRHLVDSSFDWGQGLPDLNRWLATRSDREPVYLTYFGADSPQARDLKVTRFADETNDLGPRSFPVRPQGGWFAISATHFQRLYLWVTGPWDERYEKFYQQAAADIGQLGRAERTPASQARLVRAAMDFEVLEFGRLCAFLRNRAPEQVVGGSILLFHLTDAEVNLALNGPAPVSP